jgi:hypothetical protein
MNSLVADYTNCRISELEIIEKRKSRTKYKKAKRWEAE